jgi:D-proline reductase (dithiol) PrdB
VTEKTPPPRALYLHFPFGHALGEPGKTNQHFAVLLLALRLLFDAKSPGTILDADLHWKRGIYPPPDWEEFKKLLP